MGLVRTCSDSPLGLHGMVEVSCGDEVGAYAEDPVTVDLCLWHTVITEDVSLLSATGLLSSWLEFYPCR